jgi:hypothetical protein
MFIFLNLKHNHLEVKKKEKKDKWNRLKVDSEKSKSTIEIS